LPNPNPLRINGKAPVKPADLNPKTKIVRVEAPPAADNSAGDTAAGNTGRAARDGKKKNH